MGIAVKQFIKYVTSTPILVGIILAVFAVARIQTDDLRLSMRLFFEVAVALSLAVWLWKQNKWVSLFLALTVVSMLYPCIFRWPPVLLFRNNVAFWESYLAFSAVFFGVGWYAVFLQYDISKLHTIYNVVCFIALVNIVWLILQYFNMDPMYYSKEDMTNRSLPVALMGNRNLISGLLAICFPAFLRMSWHPSQKNIKVTSLFSWLAIKAFLLSPAIFIPLIIWGLIQAGSTGGVLAVVVGFCAFSVMRGRSMVTKFAPVVVSIACLVMYCVLVDMPSLSRRYNPWLFAFEKWWYGDWFFMGCGIGQWKMIALEHKTNPVFYGELFLQLHNDLLQGLVEMGIGFAVIVVGYYRDICKRASVFNVFKGREINPVVILPLTFLVAITVEALVSFPFHIGTLAMVSIPMLSVSEVSLREQYNEKNS